MTRKVNYLNNKDLLIEIHKSKNTYCEYVDEKYSMYDIIVDDKDECLDADTIHQAKIKRASRLTKQAVDAWNGEALKKSEIEKRVEVVPDSIDTEDLVFRVSTFEHIPDSPGRKKTPKKTADHHVRLNFLPFKHFVIRNGELVEVGRSHSKDGKFCQSHGAITDKLARMFIMLVNRYGQKSNWRGYCVDEETQALTKRGWLGINEITTDDIILSYNEGSLTWSKIKSIFRDEYNGLMHQITTKRGIDMLITPRHKLVTERGLIPVEYILSDDRIVLLGDAVEDSNDFTESYSNDLVELYGWVITEGHYEYTSCKTKLKRICIWQNEGKYADRIRKCLINLGYKFSESTNKKNICFAISRKDSRKFAETFPVKNLSMDVILSLSKTQRELLIETMVCADGWYRGSNMSYCQKDETHIRLFQILCVLSGRRSSVSLVSNKSYGVQREYYISNIYSKKKNFTRGWVLDFNGGKRNGRDGQTQLGNGKLNHPNKPTYQYNGMVWCPETEYGSFVAKRNDSIYLTGNTYLDEMKGNALLQLSSMGLQFNEAKSDNPFAYLTATITNSFTRVLNTEKRNQNIRDDLLQEAGKNPSFTRQIEHEEEIRRLREEIDAKDN